MLFFMSISPQDELTGQQKVKIRMNLSDLTRNSNMLIGSLSRRGYMRWWHSFSGVNAETGEKRTFFVEFFIINPGLGREQPILGQHPYFKRRGIKPSYVLVKAGAFPCESDTCGRQLHAFYPISSLKASGCPLVMQVEDCLYSEDRISGFVEVSAEEANHRSFMTDAGYMEWELEVHKSVSCHTGIYGGRFMQFINALDSYWHGEGIRSFFKGTVTLDNEVYNVTPEDSYGYADKHWGRCFNNPWLLFTCCQMTSRRAGTKLRHSALAINGCHPRFLCFRLRRKLMLQLTYMGEDFEFTRCRWEAKETNKRIIWHIMAQSKDAVLKLSGSCTKELMMFLQYENPDGNLSRFPLWAGAAGIGTIQLYRRTAGGRELLDTLYLENAFCEYRAEEKQK